MTTRMKRVRRGLVIGLIAIGSACVDGGGSAGYDGGGSAAQGGGGGSGAQDGGNIVISVSKLVGPEGGSLQLSDGAKVEIPAGALSEATLIKITQLELADVAQMPNTVEARGKPYAFEPHGTLFAQPVKITVPFNGEGTQVRPFKLEDEDDSDWSIVADDTKQGTTISFDSNSFSVIAAAALL